MTEQIREWSTNQKGVFHFVSNGSGNAIVKAVAGSGKTTTIVEALKLCGSASTIFLAFNKKIAEELKRRGVNARTFHSLTYSIVTRHKNARTVSTDKLRTLVEENMIPGAVRMYGSFATKLVGLARQAGIGCLVPDTEAAWFELVNHHDLELESEEATLETGVDFARKLLEWSNASALVDFDDLLYIAVKDGLSLPKFEFIFVDEAQDTNAIQRALLRKMCKANTRIIAVGDPAQAIYGFRGADSDSLELIAKEFDCTELPLTVSYRCPRAVVAHAQNWVSHIEAAPSAPEGRVVALGTNWSHKDFRPGDMVVCRSTKPLVALAYTLLKSRVAVSIAGRDIGQSLEKLVTKMRAQGIDQLVKKLEAFTTREVEKAIAKKQEEKADAIQDKTDAILCLIEGLDENNRTIPGLLKVLQDLFSEVSNAVLLSTIHKAKGLESETVFWLNSGKGIPKWAKQEWQIGQEKNLCYVATTRAMDTLVLIEEVKKS